MSIGRAGLVLAALAVVSCSGTTTIADDAGVSNLAVGASVISSSPGPGSGVRTVADGDMNTGWTGPDPPYWFEIDLGEQVAIERVRVLVGRDVVAKVGVNVGVHDNPGRRPGSFDGALPGGDWLDITVDYEARFIRVTVEEADGHATWLEVEVIPG